AEARLQSFGGGERGLLLLGDFVGRRTTATPAAGGSAPAGRHGCDRTSSSRPTSRATTRFRAERDAGSSALLSEIAERCVSHRIEHGGDERRGYPFEFCS